MGKNKGSLPPGFRFHPTDLELIRYYLRRKLMGKPLLFEAIAVVDLYKFSPWDLPDKSCLRSKDLEWYFFCPRDRKYANGQRTNRATEKGYWKTTGKDRTIVYKDMTVGMKKTLVFYMGRAPNGSRTDWVMHEYRLEDKELIETDFSQDTFVLCRIFQKSGPGPKNGEQYGAPFSEEEWNYDEEDDVASHSHLSLAPDSESPSLGLAHDNSPLSLIVHENDTPDTVAAPLFIELNSSDCDLENMLLNFADNEDFELLPGVDQMANSGKDASARDDTSAIFDGLGDITTKEELQAIDKLNLENDNFVEIDDLSVVDAVEADSFGHGTFAASDILGDPSSWEMEMAQFLRDPSSASWEMETLN